MTEDERAAMHRLSVGIDGHATQWKRAGEALGIAVQNWLVLASTMAEQDRKRIARNRARRRLT